MGATMSCMYVGCSKPRLSVSNCSATRRINDRKGWEKARRIGRNGC